MTETFRLEVFNDLTTEVPRRFLTLLGISEGGEIRITTKNGAVESVLGIPRAESAPEVQDDEVTARRRQEISSGKHEDVEKFEQLFAKRSARSANTAG